MTAKAEEVATVEEVEVTTNEAEAKVGTTTLRALTLAICSINLGVLSGTSFNLESYVQISVRFERLSPILAG